MVDAQQIISILRQVRPMLLPHWGQAHVTHQSNEWAYSVVTKLDIEIEMFVRTELHNLYPDIEFVGEEKGGNRSAERFWLMDPIDGTGHFVRGLPFCTSMLALIEDGQVTFGAVYDFLNDKMYYAELGKGAFCNNERLQVSNRALKDAYVSLESRVEKTENLVRWSKLRNHVVFMNTVSAGWEYAMTAAGKLDARITADPYCYDYDVAPGSLLVAEAGGVVANLGKRTFDYRDVDFIAANPIIYQELIKGKDAIFPLH